MNSGLTFFSCLVYIKPRNPCCAPDATRWKHHFNVLVCSVAHNSCPHVHVRHEAIQVEGVLEEGKKTGNRLKSNNSSRERDARYNVTSLNTISTGNFIIHVLIEFRRYASRKSHTCLHPMAAARILNQPKFAPTSTKSGRSLEAVELHLPLNI